MDRRRFVGTSALGAAAAAIGGCASLTPRQPPAPPTAIHPPSPEFLSHLERLMEIGGVPGVGMGLVQDGRLAWEHHAGLGNVARNRPVGPDTLHSAASLSKQLFAYAALRLVDRGLLDLDAPLKSYVPDHTPAHDQADRVTPRHVLCHSSGFPNWRQEDVPLVPAFAPGSEFRYSGEGYYYLQRAVEHVTGMGFERFMQETLLGPLGMRDTSYVWSAHAEERATEGYNKGDARWPSARDFSLRLAQSTTRGTKPVAELHHEDIVQALAGITPKPRTLPNALAPNCAFTLLTTVRDYCAFLAQVLTNGNVGSSPVSVRAGYPTSS